MIKRNGTFVAVVGPSGAGKDTLLGWARRELRDDSGFVFARRVITRPPDLNENHEAIDEPGFKSLAAAGGFALQWQAHGLHYGIPFGVCSELERGRIVVANLSRSVLTVSRSTFSEVLIVEVTASAHVLAQRLANRGREAAEDQAQRLKRAEIVQMPIPAGIKIINDGALKDAGHLLVNVLLRAVTPQESMLGL